MATDRTKYQIGIEVTADDKGIHTAREGLKNVGQDAKAAAAHLDALKTKLAALQSQMEAAGRMGVSVHGADAEAASLTRQIATATKATHEMGEGFEVSHKVAHEALHLLADDAANALGPIMELTHFMADPELLATAGLSVAIKMLIDRHEELVEQQRKNIEASGNLRNSLEEASEAASRDTATAIHALNEQFKDFGSNIDRATESMNRFIAVQHEATVAANTTATAVTALMEANINLAQQTGQLSEPEANAAREHVRQQAAAAAEQRSEAELQSTIEARRRRLEAAKTERETAQANAEALTNGPLAERQKAVNEVAARAKDLEDDLPGMKQRADLAKAKIPGWQEELNIEKSLLPYLPIGVLRSAALGRMGKLKDEIETGQQGITNEASTREALKKERLTQSKLESELHDLQHDIDQQREIASKRSELYHEQMQILEEDERHLAEQRAAFQQNTAITTQTEHVNRLTTLQGVVSRGTATPEQQEEYAGAAARDPGALARNTVQRLGEIERAARLNPGGRPDQSQQAEMHAIMDRIIGLLENSHQLRSRDQSQLRQIQDRLAEMESQMRQSGNVRG